MRISHFPASRFLLPALLLSIGIIPSSAASLNLTPDKYFLAGDETSAPLYLSGANAIARIRYTVPNFSTLLSIDAATVWLTLYDDGPDASNESGDLLLGQAPPLTNLFLRDFGQNRVDGYTSGSPNEIKHVLDASERLALYTEIMNNGRFAIRVERTGGDYYVGGGRIEMNVTQTPEPAAFSLLGAGLLGFAAIARLRRRA